MPVTHSRSRYRLPMMIRLFKIAGWTCSGLIGAAALFVGAVFLWPDLFITMGEQWGREIPVTKNYADEIRAVGHPISIERVFVAAAYDAFHGDGSSVTAYRYPQGETEALIAALKKKEPTYVWSDIAAKDRVIEPRRGLIPRDFLPAGDLSRLIAAKPSHNVLTFEFLVDPSRGTLYCISNQY
jgi:hypothetical protein